jgi:hypothetical protein
MKDYNNPDYPTLHTQVTYTPVSDVDKEFLTSRPWWTKDDTTLNSHLQVLFPGSHLVGTSPTITTAPFLAHIVCLSHDINIDMVERPDQAPTLMLGTRSDAYHNVVQFVNEGKIDQHVIGYALSADGKWRLHSWGFQKDSTLVETTEIRIVYLGLFKKELTKLYELTMDLWRRKKQKVDSSESPTDQKVEESTDPLPPVPLLPALDPLPVESEPNPGKTRSKTSPTTWKKDKPASPSKPKVSIKRKTTTSSL